jgi:histidyl-tRNA synthetase
LEILRGFKDTLPTDIGKWHRLENTSRDILESFGYKEIRTPILEKTSLFARGVGETTDIVEKEMYTFLDKSSESVTMRPEGTAGVVRSFIDNHLENLPNKKFYYIGPMFRYERPQKGRLRQFNQIGVEVFGIDNPSIDAEVVYMDKFMLERLGIKDLKIEINNIGCNECRPKYMDELKSYFSKHKESLCDDCKRRLDKNPLRILDCKNKSCKQIANNAPKITKFACDSCKEHYNNVKDRLTSLSIEFIENPHLVRGLDYYTKFVFEIITEKLGSQGTVSAGGRYDGLIEELGGKDTPGIGFASGCERLIELMEEKQEKLFDYYIANMDCDEYAINIAAKLIESTNKRVYVEYEKRSLKSMMKKAGKMDVSFVVIAGENEKNNKTVILKDMDNSNQSEYELKTFLDNEVKRWL